MRSGRKPDYKSLGQKTEPLRAVAINLHCGGDMVVNTFHLNTQVADPPGPAFGANHNPITKSWPQLHRTPNLT